MRPRLYRPLSLAVALLFAACLCLASDSAAAPRIPDPSSVGALGAPQSLEAALKIEPALLKRLSQGKEAQVPFVAYFSARADLGAVSGASPVERRGAIVRALQDAAARAQGATLSLLAARAREGRAARVRPFWIANSVAGRADRETILALAARPEVEIVRLDHTRRIIEAAPPDFAALSLAPLRQAQGGLLQQAQSVEWNIAKVRADQVWNAFNITGAGVVVANMDTGVDWQHPALQTKYRGYRGGGPPVHTGNWYDASGSGYLYPGDGNGHGTHTMGTLVGGTTDLAIGVAPGAQWIAVKAFSDDGYADDSWIHAGYQWLIAPNGDPSLAPAIISNSWGDDNGLNTAFLDDVRALRAAGILPVFASGNNGLGGAATVGAPASYAESVAAGATDSADGVAYFSSRGPSPLTGGVKPEVAAPGVAVESSYRGGGYATLSGTSMATPHVAGLAALLRQAAPTLTLTDTIHVITSTAAALGSVIPNNDTGWGRVDAYAAVFAVTSSGTLSGSVTSTDAPITGAQIQATDRLTRTTQTTSDAGGRYQLPLSEGLYSVSVSAFGFNPSLNNSVWISSGLTTTLNITLTAVPTGTVRGRVSDLSSGSLLSATVSALNTPASAQADATGTYTLVLPIGDYTLRAANWLYRVVTATVTLTASAVVTQDFSLPSAPSLLLVDSGAWYGDSQISIYQNALDALGYLYTTRPITSPVGAAPGITEMLSYSLTIWSAPLDSPDYVGAGQTVIEYLDRGGRLLLSGQDIALWDGGTIYGIGNDYFTQRLYGSFVSDNITSTLALGTSGEPLAGITFTLNTSDSAQNQLSIDQVAPLNDNARALATYTSGGVAGLEASICLAYRVAYLAFGLEGVGPASARQQALDNLIQWAMAPPPAHALTLSADSGAMVGLPGQPVTRTVNLRNTGQATDSFTLTLAGNQWPVSLWDSSGKVTQPLTQPVQLDPCATLAVSVRVDIPADAPRNISDTLSLTAQSSGGLTPAPFAVLALVNKTPAPVLLVDDDRWYEMEGYYQSALSANAIPYDLRTFA